ncbi:MAG: hypothetical protein ABH951_02925 [Patescibacteria group bacterium]
MDISILFVKILAVYFIVSGIFLILRGKTLPMVLKDFFSHPAIVFLAGVMLIFLSAGILIQQGSSNSSVEVWAKVMAWLTFIKGVIYIFIPKILAKIPVAKLNNFFGLIGIIMMSIGIYLLFFL